MIQEKKGVTCIVCAHERTAEIDAEVTSNRRAVGMISKKYGIGAAALIGHSRSCIETPVSAYVDALERDAARFEELAHGIMQRYGEPDGEQDRVSAFDLKCAIDLQKLANTMRRDALKARGYLATEADVMKSPEVTSLWRELMEALYADRFAADGFAAAGVAEEIGRLFAGEE